MAWWWVGGCVEACALVVVVVVVGWGVEGGKAEFLVGGTRHFTSLNTVELVI